MNTVTEIKTLNRESVAEYIEKHAAAAALEKRLAELKKELLPQLVDGATSPADLPALLINRSQERPQADWKGFALALLIQRYKRRDDGDARAHAEIAAKETSWPKKEHPALHVVLNPDYVSSAPCA